MMISDPAAGRPASVGLGPGLFLLWLVLACTPLSAGADDDSSERVLRSLQPAISIEGNPPEHWAVVDRMAHHHVAGLSVAVADKGRIVWARGCGLQKAGGREQVTATTLFQAASISKVVAAT